MSRTLRNTSGGKAVSGGALSPRTRKTNSSLAVDAWRKGGGGGGIPLVIQWQLSGGGGSGGSSGSSYGVGGGGAGGFRNAIGTETSGRGAATEAYITAATGSGVWTVTIGGAASNSSIARTGMTTITALRGGHGTSGNGGNAGQTHGSGGGGAVYCQNYGWYVHGPSYGTAGQGYDGNTGANGGAYPDGRCIHQGHAGPSTGGSNRANALTTYAYSAAGTATGYGGYNSSVTNISGYFPHGSLEDFQGYASSGSVAAQGANTGGGGHANQSGNSGYCIMRYSEEFDDATVTGSPTMYINQGFKIYRFTGNGTLTF